MSTSNSGQPYSQERCYVFKDLTYSACNREKPHVLSVVAFFFFSYVFEDKFAIIG